MQHQGVFSTVVTPMRNSPLSRQVILDETKSPSDAMEIDPSRFTEVNNKQSKRGSSPPNEVQYLSPIAWKTPTRQHSIHGSVSPPVANTSASAHVQEKGLDANHPSSNNEDTLFEDAKEIQRDETPQEALLPIHRLALYHWEEGPFRIQHERRYLLPVYPNIEWDPN